jgi:hypothetical protein
VFYLIDASGSLFAQPGQTGTDPDNVRSDLIANSLSELASLSPDLDVSYALGFFGTSYRLAIPWSTVAQGGAESQSVRLRDTIRAQGSLGWTNWQSAIDGAQQELAAQHKVTGGCQLLVWLTDGGINLNGDNGALDDAALNDMCGAPVRPGSPPARGYGVFNELRQAGVVVVGVLLKVPGGSGAARDSVYMPYMRPLVEGTGDVGGSQIICGEYPAPEGYTAGALVEASSASDLARVFVDLGVVVGGGYPSPFGAGGTIPVDPGISSFAIVTNSTNWVLTEPGGRELTSASPGDATVATTSGVTRIDMRTTAVNPETWTWTSVSPADDGLYYYGSLAVQIDEPSTFLAGADNRLTGTISRTDGRDLVLDHFSFNLRLAAVTFDGTQPIDPDALEIDKETGSFVFHYSEEHASGVVTLEARVENLVTLPNRIALTSVSARRDVTMTMPTQYPTVAPLPLVLTDLEGVNGKASAVWTVSAPADGSVGKVCFPSGLTPSVVNDSADRNSDWSWTIDVKDKCIEVASGTRQLAVTASNRIAANSEVSAILSVEYVSVDGGVITGTLPIQFSSTRPIDAAVFGILTGLLLLAGILGPLGLLLFFMWLTHKISRGSRIQRANFPVFIQADGVVLDTQKHRLLDTDFGTEHFGFQTTQPDARIVQDESIGTLRARISLNPFGRPWFEMVPRAGRALVGSTGHLPLRREQLALRGHIAGFNGDLGAAWALVLPDAALETKPKDGELISATLVVFLRNTTNEKAAMKLRMTEILVAPTIADRIDRARSLRADDAKRGKSEAESNSRGGSELEDALDADDPSSRSRTTTDDDPPHSPSRSRGSQDPPPPSSSRTMLGGESMPESSRTVSKRSANSAPSTAPSGSGNSDEPTADVPTENSGPSETDDPPASPWRSR